MKWKVIGQKAIGTSHVQSGKNCEDFFSFDVIQQNEEQVLICCLSDGAGSAQYAAEAANLVTSKAVEFLKQLVIKNEIITQATILSLTEFLFDELEEQASYFESALNEFSCTFLGCVLYQDRSVFFQIGDGIIVRNDSSGNYTTIWLPQNGEYSNTTTFLIDDIYFGNLKFKEIDETIDEIALTTDGLQILILNNDTNNIHQPFFLELFKWLRLANSPEQIDILEKKLQDYISSDIINNRTNDDKTLILATRLNA